MRWLFLIGWLLFGIAGLLYLCRFQIRRWWRSDVVNRDLLPHQRWPEILQWRAGDEFQGLGGHYLLVSIESDGYAVVDRLGQRSYMHLSRLVGKNASARTRRINKRLAQSNEYMELLQEFNKAVAELEERDKRLKLVS